MPDPVAYPTQHRVLVQQDLWVWCGLVGLEICLTVVPLLDFQPPLDTVRSVWTRLSEGMFPAVFVICYLKKIIKILVYLMNSLSGVLCVKETVVK